jgi:hypothetical protein
MSAWSVQYVFYWTAPYDGQSQTEFSKHDCEERQLNNIPGV